MMDALKSKVDMVFNGRDRGKYDHISRGYTSPFTHG